MPIWGHASEMLLQSCSNSSRSLMVQAHERLPRAKIKMKELAGACSRLLSLAHMMGLMLTCRHDVTSDAVAYEMSHEIIANISDSIKYYCSHCSKCEGKSLPLLLIS